MPTADSEVFERLLYFYSIALPSKWEMEKELGMRYLSIGVVRSALEVFKRLEMWEEVVKCWQSMERSDKAITIVRDLLEGRKEESDAILSRGKATSETRRSQMDVAREAKLWCLLGDLEPANAVQHYQHAWEISKQTSGRAVRSLGGYHFARGNYSEAIGYLNKAVAINPLQHRSWFLLGCAHIRVEQWLQARDAFSKCVSIDDEDGESWNNLASVYMRMATPRNEGSDETNAGSNQAAGISVPFENKILAFRALKQGLKYKFENWRMWTNYMLISMDVGELSEACQALGRVVELRAEKDGSKVVDIDVLDRLVGAVTRGENDESGTSGGVEDQVEDPKTRITHGLERQVTELFSRTILPRISSSPRIFQAYARLLTHKEQWVGALEAHLNAYRTSVGSDTTVETDIARWREAITEVEEIVDILRNLGPKALAGHGTPDSPQTQNWDFQAKSIVRSFMGRTKESFGDEPEWERLTALMTELRRS
jgi:tetratricopeptide (TPR) repeat protein